MTTFRKDMLKETSYLRLSFQVNVVLQLNLVDKYNTPDEAI